MRKNHPPRLLSLTAALLLCGSAAAANLSLAPASQDAAPGGTVFIDLLIDGLGDLTGPSLSVFEVVVGFDPVVLSYVDHELGLALGDPDTEAIDLSLGVLGPGTVNIAETSFLDDSELIAGQASAFTLATLEFLVDPSPPAGVTQLVVDTVVVLGDEFVDPLAVGTLSGAAVTIVPVPPALWLITGAIGLLVGCRRGVLGPTEDGRRYRSVP